MRWLVIVALVYLIGWNPFPFPSVYDNLVYFEGARSLLDSGSYSIFGEKIMSWPPGFSLLLIPFSSSIFLAKGFVLFTAFLSWWLIVLYLKKEQREWPILILVLFALSPDVFQSGTRVMSEYPYILFSFGFLLCLDDLKSRRTLFWTLLTAFLLLFSIQIRLVGVALMAPVLLQLYERRKEGNLPEMVVALFGFFSFLCWEIYKQILLLMDVDTGKVYHTIGTFQDLDFITLWRALADSLFSVRFYDSFYPHLLYLILPVLLIVGALKQKKIRASDSYVIAMLFILFLFPYKGGRYFVPILPFLFSYLLSLHRFIPKLAPALVLLYLAYDGVLLFYGNGTTYNAMISRTPEEFYRGYWKEIYLGNVRNEEVKNYTQYFEEER